VFDLRLERHDSAGGTEQRDERTRDEAKPEVRREKDGSQPHGHSWDFQRKMR